MYYGDILTNPKKRAQHIADIRMQFHPQLKKLVTFQPWNNLTKFMMPDDDVTIKVSYEKVLLNPITGDRISLYVLLLLISIIGLLITKIYNNKTKDIK